jgi:hypothetical protein
MALIIKRSEEGNFDRELISEGTIQMVISGVVDLGTQEVKKYQSEEIDHVHQILVAFEVGEDIEEGDFAGKPKMTYVRYKLSMHKKSKLFALVKALAGASKAEQLAVKGFDIYKMVGMNCFGTFEHRVTQSGNELSVLINVSELPKNIEKMEVRTPITDDDNAPEWIKKIKQKAVDYCLMESEELPEPAKKFAAPAKKVTSPKPIEKEEVPEPDPWD